MSQLDDARQHHIPSERAVRAEGHLDWAVLVVLLAVGCTLAWAFFWLWAIVRGLQVALS